MSSKKVRDPDAEYSAGTCPFRVQDIPEHERPREWARRVGLEHVPDSVLLALILRSGVRGRSVIQVANDLMKRYGSVARLAQTSVDELASIGGMGPIKAQVLKAALEIGQRMVSMGGVEKARITTAEQAARLFYAVTRQLQQESFMVLLLDRKGRPKQPPIRIFTGTLDCSLAHPREVFALAVKSSASALILGHNHPSGDTTPSAQDIQVTRQMIDSGKIIDIRVLDHIIVGSDPDMGELRYTSLREMGCVEL